MHSSKILQIIAIFALSASVLSAPTPGRTGGLTKPTRPYEPGEEKADKFDRFASPEFQEPRKLKKCYYYAKLYCLDPVRKHLSKSKEPKSPRHSQSYRDWIDYNGKRHRDAHKEYYEEKDQQARAAKEAI